MPNDDDDFIPTLRSQIEERVRNQIRRHLKIDPNIDPRRIVDLQIAQERERLERASDSLGPNAHAAIDALIEWLPDLANELKRR
jgi:hypothetical protein